MPKVGKSELVNSDSMSRLKSTIYIWRVVRLELTELVAIATLVRPLEEHDSRRIMSVFQRTSTTTRAGMAWGVGR